MRWIAKGASVAGSSQQEHTHCTRRLILNTNLALIRSLGQGQDEAGSVVVMMDCCIPASLSASTPCGLSLNHCRGVRRVGGLHLVGEPRRRTADRRAAPPGHTRPTRY